LDPCDLNDGIKKDLHKANVGVEALAGISRSFGKHEIFLEGGGNYGFVKIQRDAANGKNNTGAAAIEPGYAYKFERNK
jgi:hypothetical protein